MSLHARKHDAVGCEKQIKFLVPRTSNVRGSNVVILKISFYQYAFVNILVKKVSCFKLHIDIKALVQQKRIAS